MKKKWILLICIFIGCQNAHKKTAQKIQNIKINTDFVLFHKAFFETDSISGLQKKYPFLFPIQFPDSIWKNQKNDENSRELYEKSKKVFKDFEEEKQILNNLFKHIKYYKPDFLPPKTFTLITNLDEEYPVVYADSLLLIGLDLFLGRDSEIYKGYPKYIKQTFDKENLAPKIAEEIIPKIFKIHKKKHTFLDHIIEKGKILYLKEIFISNAKEKDLIGYDTEKMLWAKDNEMVVWRYFIDHNLLFSTDRKLLFRFVNPAPFSKFYIANDRETPGRIGLWIGWQIVRQFMKKNVKIPIEKMLKMEATTLFEKAKYKPEK